MTMTRRDFKQLCRKTSAQLELFEPDAMGAGATFLLDEVECELTLHELKRSAQLTCRLGDPEPETEGTVYRRLLEIQATFVGQMDAMFVRDSIRDRLLFTCRIPLHAKLTPAGFAQALKTLAWLVARWQTAMLGNALVDYEHELEKRTARLAAPDAETVHGGLA